MNLATLTTKAPAVRQHGGGRALRYLLTLLLGARPAMPAGGETNSHCCAAAGINPTLPKASRGHAYPTKGVRQAQEPTPSLRSPNRPHAQPVMGYTHHPLDVMSALYLLPVSQTQQSPDCQAFTVPIRHSAETLALLGGAA